MFLLDARQQVQLLLEESLPLGLLGGLLVFFGGLGGDGGIVSEQFSVTARVLVPQRRVLGYFGVVEAVVPALLPSLLFCHIFLPLNVWEHGNKNIINSSCLHPSLLSDG